MNDITLTKICFIITLLGFVLFLFFYEDDFKEKTISEMILKEGNYGLVTGKITSIIKEPTIFIISNETSIKVFAPNNRTITLGSIVKIYAQTQIYNGEIELYAYKVELQ